MYADIPHASKSSAVAPGPGLVGGPVLGSYTGLTPCPWPPAPVPVSCPVALAPSSSGVSLPARLLPLLGLIVSACDVMFW